MPVLAESKNISDLVKLEGTQRYSREVVTLPTGTTVAIGTLLKPGTGGTFVPVVAADTAVSFIALQAIPIATTAPTKIPVLARFAILVDSGIAYPAGATAPQKTALRTAVTALDGVKFAVEETTP